jgi:hypothetical protein
VLAACAPSGSGSPDPAGADAPPVAPLDPAIELFVDRAAETGLDFVHFNGMSGSFYQPEMMGPGAGLFDYDNDGDLDVYVAQGELLGSGTPLLPLPAGQPAGDRLFRNDLEVRPDGTRVLRFTDVTAESGLPAGGYGMGVAAGDFDNDGFVDLYLTRFGPNRMLRNRGDGTFADVSAETGTDEPSWGVPATFLDFDRDGWLDLFVGNYLNYTLDTHTQCYNRAGPPDYCPPEVSPAAPSRLYRNRGDGTFAEVTAAAGLGREFGPALGAAAADFDNDGRIDLFVANDQQENQLWMNQGGGAFRNLALLQGVALGAAGDAKADMGVDAGDFDNDGDEDLFITELTGQGSTLYVNGGAGVFEDLSAAMGIRAASLPYTGFGAGWLDIDNDGWLDIVAVNGLVTQRLESLGPENPFPLDQRNQAFRNLAGLRFEDVSARAGAPFARSAVSRGAAFGDVDNDGDTDILVANAAGRVELLINQVGQRRDWIGLRLVGSDVPRTLVGARVAVAGSDGITRHRRARADGSYASAHDSRVLVGLGDEAADALAVQVIWPDGRTEQWSAVPLGRYSTLVRGEGEPR